jgi:hypothetical protein
MKSEAEILLERATARLLEAARVLGVPAPSPTSPTLIDHVTASRDNAKVTFRISQYGTTITVKLAEAPGGLLLEVTEQTQPVPYTVAASESVDVVVGDPAFDLKFHVEGAPSDVIRAVLDEPLRRFLLSRHPCRLELHDDEVRFFDNNALPVDEVEHAIERVLRFAVSLAVVARDVELARGRETESVAIERRQTRARVELERLESMRSVGSIMIPTSMAVGAAGHIALAFAFLPWTYALLTMLLLPVSAMIGGIGLYLVFGVTADLVGISGLLRRRRERTYAALMAAAADPPTE